MNGLTANNGRNNTQKSDTNSHLNNDQINSLNSDNNAPLKSNSTLFGMHEKPELILQRLIQYNTTNPPGNEVACIQFVRELLLAYDIDSQIIARDDNRPNLIARLKGEGSSPPLMMYGHVDVVTVDNQSWTHPPFSGAIIDDYVWGRGALDMKGGVAMMIAAFLKAKQEQLTLPGDVLLVIVSDEENGGDYGARFLVNEHPDLFDGVQYALGEFGAFSMYIGEQRFYPLMIAEKQMCWTKLVIRGPGGHASMPVKGGAMAKLAHIIDKLEKGLPVHISPPVKLMIESVATHLPLAKRIAMKQLLNPMMTNGIIKLMGEQGAQFDSLLHHTAAPTIVQASDKVNVIPSEITLEIDGRVLPGFTENDFVEELRQLINDDSVEIDVLRSDIAEHTVKMDLFDMLTDVLKEADPEGIPIPFVLPGVTDGRFFSKLGIQTYGFLPMNLPRNLPLTRIVHAADERIPVEALYFGTASIYKVLGRF